MDTSRKILHNLALRLRYARRKLNYITVIYGDYSKQEHYALGQWIEANNSFQAAKQIYLEGK